MIDSDLLSEADLVLILRRKEIKIWKSRWGDLDNDQKNIINVISTMLARSYVKDHDIQLFEEGLREDFKKAITDVMKKHNLIENKPLTNFEQSVLDSSLDRDPFTRIFRLTSKVK